MGRAGFSPGAPPALRAVARRPFSRHSAACGRLRALRLLRGGAASPPPLLSIPRQRKGQAGRALPALALPWSPSRRLPCRDLWRRGADAAPQSAALRGRGGQGRRWRPFLGGVPPPFCSAAYRGGGGCWLAVLPLVWAVPRGGFSPFPSRPLSPLGKGEAARLRRRCGGTGAGFARLCRAGLLTKKRGKSRAKAISTRSCSPTVAPSPRFLRANATKLFYFVAFAHGANISPYSLRRTIRPYPCHSRCSNKITVL